MSPDLPHLIRFAPFEVDTRSGELRRQGSRVKLQEQPFQVLLLLLERSGEVVTREELSKRLWPDNTFIDVERGLNKAINKLRDALRDDAENPRFVETLPQHGYRFIAAVGRPVWAVRGTRDPIRRVRASGDIAVPENVFTKTGALPWRLGPP